MGFLDKLKFWKREEEAPLELGEYPALAAGPAPAELPGMAPPGMAQAGGPGITELPDFAESDQPGRRPALPGEMAPGAMPHLEELGPAPPPPMRGIGAPAPSAFAPAPVMQPPAADLSRDMQIVQAKLDTLKALLESVTTKLERLDRKLPEREEEAVPLSVRRWR